MSAYEDDPDSFDNFYDTLSPAQKSIADEIIARNELDEEEFQQLIDEPQYYLGEEE